MAAFYGFLGKIFVGFLAVVAALGGVGLWQLRRRSAGKGSSGLQEEEGVLSPRIVDNVFNLKDGLNRARYMDRDGEQASADRETET